MSINLSKIQKRMSANNFLRLLLNQRALLHLRITQTRQQNLPSNVCSPALLAPSCRFLHNTSSHHTSAPTSQQLQDEQSAEMESEELSENDQVNPDFVNRNPRNLEKMALARKDKGWAQSFPRMDYWHRLHLTKTNRHITARVHHYNGAMVLEASTKEWAIKRHLYSTSDVAAAGNLGRVLAQRCLESGISYVNFNVKRGARKQEKMKAFVEAVKEGGLILNEPKTIVDFREPTEYFPKAD